MKSSTRYRVIEILELMAGSVLPIIFWVSVILGFDAPYVAVLTILSAVIHEIGHCAAISLLTEKSAKLNGHTTGFRIRHREIISYSDEIKILLAGPGSNIVIFLISLCFGNILSGYVKVLGYINLATGISNLLPLEGYDGYGAFSAFLRSHGKQNHLRILESFSFIFSVVLTFISLHIIDAVGEGYWIFGLFFFTFISKLVNLGKYDIFEA